MKGTHRTAVALLLAAFCCAGPALVRGHAVLAANTPIKWHDALRQKAAWYSSSEAVHIADTVILYQRDSGGWPKNIDMATVLTEPERATLASEKHADDSTIDNGATYTQLIFLARVYVAKRSERHKESFLRGVDYLLRAQDDNGGWPQYYPRLTGYYRHITFNDDAMIGVMQLLRDIAAEKPTYLFVDGARRARSETAVAKGIECILKTQVIVRGKRTVWCAQHDEVTLAPAPARTYEPISLSGLESVGVVRFLMGIDRPGPRIVASIESGIAWFKSAEINGIRWIEKADATKSRGFDHVVVAGQSAPPLWARFYEIDTNRPIFSGRDSVIKYNVAQIEDERRNGYRWYTDAPAKLIDKDYPAWLAKMRAAKTGMN